MSTPITHAKIRIVPPRGRWMLEYIEITLRRDGATMQTAEKLWYKIAPQGIAKIQGLCSEDNVILPGNLKYLPGILHKFAWSDSRDDQPSRTVEVFSKSSNDGPFVKSAQRQEWHRMGLLHRDSGPALITTKDNVVVAEKYIDGKKVMPMERAPDLSLFGSTRRRSLAHAPHGDTEPATRRMMLRERRELLGIAP